MVTAQKREQNLQTVGTSITAFDGAALQKLGITDVTAIANQTPDMQFNQYGATITVYNLRGVSQNDFSDHQEAPIAVYADDAYIASMGALAGSLFDIEHCSSSSPVPCPRAPPVGLHKIRPPAGARAGLAEL